MQIDKILWSPSGKCNKGAQEGGVPIAQEPGKWFVPNATPLVRALPSKVGNSHNGAQPTVGEDHKEE